MGFFYFYQNEAFFSFWVPDSVYRRTIRKAVRGLIVSSQEPPYKKPLHFVVPWMGFSAALHYNSPASSTGWSSTK